MTAPEIPPSEPPRPFAPARPLVLGLVGGIASGKSTVAALFAAHGLRHIDADAHARAASQAPHVLAQVRSQLGQRFVSHGQLDRAALAAKVFSEPAAKATLEAILHPEVRARIRAELAEASRSGRSSLLDVPLLFEAGLFEDCDHVVFVEASDATRRERALARGWADDELERRERNQLPIHEKRERSDFTVSNDGDLAETRGAVAALLRGLEARA
ncbi:MAG: dephospho-CoA kinase [Planctomycetota bacterium]